jgi:penicillin V acylase-like amidase (Ntn superfamily)
MCTGIRPTAVNGDVVYARTIDNRPSSAPIVAVPAQFS